MAVVAPARWRFMCKTFYSASANTHTVYAYTYRYIYFAYTVRYAVLHARRGYVPSLQSFYVKVNKLLKNA